MRVFVTGAAGFIGTETTKELIAHGHKVVGLARSDANIETLKKLGAEVHQGSLTDLDSLKRGARDADGVIHLAFIHDFTKFAENGAIDKTAIEAMGDEFLGGFGADEAGGAGDEYAHAERSLFKMQGYCYASHSGKVVSLYRYKS